MKHINYNEVPADNLMLPGAEQATIRFLIGPEDAPNFIMVMIELAPGGNTPEHNHGWEEEIFVIKGEGTLKTGEGEKRLRGGDALIIDQNMTHQFFNTGNELLQFICVLPKMY